MPRKNLISLSPPKSLITSEMNKGLPYYRSAFMRDRDRILYSKAFRRLAGKTQVYYANTNDHIRTRLTHTLEVAQIAKTISTALNLDIDLTEAIALGHDIGHTPFGHAGEQILHELMTQHILKGRKTEYIDRSPYAKIVISEEAQKCAGFKHNWQSVRIAVDLEKIYGEDGLGLTKRTLFGILYHTNLEYNKDIIPYNYNKLDFYINRYPDMISENWKNVWSFEAFVVALADEIAQRHHDLEDAIRGKLITTTNVIDLLSKLKSDMLRSDRGNFNKLCKIKDDTDHFIGLVSKIVVNLLVTKTINTSRENLLALIKKHNLNKRTIKEWYSNVEISEVENIIKFDNDDGFNNRLKIFKEAISNSVISSYLIQCMDAKGQYILRKIFQAFYDNPQQLPDKSIASYCKFDEEFNKSIEGDQEKGIGYIRYTFTEYFKERNEDKKLKLMRVICDHISGMTDNYAMETYSKLYGNKCDSF